MIIVNYSLTLQTEYVLGKTWKEGSTDSQKDMPFKIQATLFLPHLSRIRHQAQETFSLNFLSS